MKRILFIAIPEKGHLNPMIGPAIWLQRFGHVVRFHSPGNISDQLRASGLIPLQEMDEQPTPADLNRGAFFAEKVRDQEWLRGWIGRLLIEEAPKQIAGYESAIRTFRPDLMVTDPMIYAAAIAAHREGVPWVAMSNSLNPVLDDCVSSDLLETVKALAPARQRLFSEHGMNLEFSGCDMLSPLLTLAFTTEAFVGRSVPHVQMVGPSLPPGPRGDESEFPWDRLSVDQPIVYMSFGSQIYYQPELFQQVAAATEPLGVQLVLSVSELLGTSVITNLGPHVLACRYVPQLSLLPKVSAFITHGGANSVMEALRFGVPMLLSPVCNDQFHQAHYLQRSGAGRVLDLTQSSVEEIRSCLLALLHDPVIKNSARQISESYAVDGALNAARLIDNLFTEEVVT